MISCLKKVSDMPDIMLNNLVNDMKYFNVGYRSLGEKQTVSVGAGSEKIYVSYQ